MLVSGNLGSRPTWSPNGKKIALVYITGGSDPTQSLLIVFDIAAKTLKTVMEVTGRYGSNRFDSEIVWSPKSDHLAIYAFRENIDDKGIYVVDLIDGSITKVADYHSAPYPIQWSEENALLIQKYVNYKHVITLIDPFTK